MSDIKTTQREYIQISGPKDVEKKKKTRIYWQNNLDSVLIDKPTESSAPAYSQLTQFAEPTLRNLVEKFGTGAFSNIVLNGNAINSTSSKQVSFYAPDLPPGSAHAGYLGIPVWRYSDAQSGGSWVWTDAQNLLDGTVLKLRINDAEQDMSLTTIYAPTALPDESVSAVSGWAMPVWGKEATEQSVGWSWMDPEAVAHSVLTNLHRDDATDATDIGIEEDGWKLDVLVSSGEGHGGFWERAWLLTGEAPESGAGYIVEYDKVAGGAVWSSVTDVLEHAGVETSIWLNDTDTTLDKDVTIYAPESLPPNLFSSGKYYVPRMSGGLVNGLPTWDWVAVETLQGSGGSTGGSVPVYLRVNGEECNLTAGTHEGWYKIYAPTDAPPKGVYGKVPVATYNLSGETFTWNWVDVNSLSGSGDDNLAAKSTPSLNINGTQCNLFERNEDNITSPHSVYAPTDPPEGSGKVPVATYDSSTKTYKWNWGNSSSIQSLDSDANIDNLEDGLYAIPDDLLRTALEAQDDHLSQYYLRNRPTFRPDLLIQYTLASSGKKSQCVFITNPMLPFNLRFLTRSTLSSGKWHKWATDQNNIDAPVGVYTYSKAFNPSQVTDGVKTIMKSIPCSIEEDDDVTVELSLNTLDARFNSANMNLYAEAAPYISAVSTDTNGVTVEITATSLVDVVYPYTVKITITRETWWTRRS